jgi:hypothetical protein
VAIVGNTVEGITNNYEVKVKVLIEVYFKVIAKSITDLILAVVELLKRDISRLVIEARETLELVEL